MRKPPTKAQEGRGNHGHDDLVEEAALVALGFDDGLHGRSAPAEGDDLDGVRADLDGVGAVVGLDGEIQGPRHLGGGGGEDFSFLSLISIHLMELQMVAGLPSLSVSGFRFGACRRPPRGRRPRGSPPAHGWSCWGVRNTTSEDSTRWRRGARTPTRPASQTWHPRGRWRWSWRPPGRRRHQRGW